MPIRPRRRDRFAPLLVWLHLALVLTSCGDGYPKDDIESDDPKRGGNGVAIVKSLNLMNETSLTATRWHFVRINPCELRLQAQRPDGRKQILKLELLHSDMQVKGNVGGPIHAVQVDFSGTSELADEHLFESDRWTDAVEYATKLQALQRICAKQG